MIIRCPACGVDMTEVSARANPGTLIILDQCGRCGGIWCDRWELFPIDADEAERIDPIDQNLLQRPTRAAKTKLYCPRCTAPLAIMADPLLPEDILLERCTRCDGIWLNRGSFRKYKNFQAQTRKKKLGTKAIVNKIPAVYQNPDSWVVAGTKGIYAHPRGPSEDDDILNKSIGSATKLVLRSLVRMVLGI